MHRFKLFIALALMSILSSIITSCDSALSDVEFDDPSLIKPWIKVIREEKIETGLNYRTEVFIFDKNYNLIELKNGGVKINETQMMLRTVGYPVIDELDYAISQGKYYIPQSSFPDIELNTLYIFNIELSDGEEFSSFVITHEDVFNQVNVPATHNSEENMIISWEVVNDYPIRIFAEYTLQSNDGTHHHSTHITVPDSLLEIGNYTIDSTFFAEHETNYETLFRIKNYKSGVINEAFQDTSIINSIHIVEKVSIIE